MNDEKQIMSIFAQAYQLLAKASKQLPSQEGFLQILEMLGEDGIQECAKVADLGPEAVALAMVQIIQLKQAQKAANGAKLLYIMQLRGICPDGYLKRGGKCKPCEMSKGSFRNKADLLGEGGNTPTNKKVPKKQGGNSIWNRLYGAITNEGVNGVGTRYNPVKLPEVNVVGKSRYPYMVDRRYLDLNNGYGVTSDMIYKVSDQYTGGPLEGLRTIYRGPLGNDTTYQYNLENPNIKLIDYGEGYMPIANGENNAKGKTKFNRAYNKTTPNSRKEMNKRK